MYKAKITSSSIQRGKNRIAIDVEFSQGKEIFSEKIFFGIDASEKEIKEKIKKFAEKLDAAKKEVVKIKNGDVDFSKIVKEVEKDEEKWFKKYYRLEKAQRLVDLGVIKAVAPVFVNLQDAVKTGFKKSYLNNL